MFLYCEVNCCPFPVIFDFEWSGFLYFAGICLVYSSKSMGVQRTTVSAILTSIQSLLDEPNPNSPANSVAAQLYQENRREYEKRVAAIVEQSWQSYSTDDDASGSAGGGGGGEPSS